MNDVAFQLKGSTMTVVVLELRRYNSASFLDELQEKISRAPEFFAGSPIVVHLEHAKNIAKTDIATLVEQCRTLGLQPMAFKGANDACSGAVRKLGLACLNNQSGGLKLRQLALPESPELAEAPKSEPEESVALKACVQDEPRRASKVITRPIRSGQQVYAQGTDLIVLSQVGKGAEVLADGHIHIYGPLRGRALAGVNGACDARIFCRQLDAEMLSIAGNFLLSASIEESLRDQAVQVHLDGDALRISQAS